jgi:hypothetical protein
MIVFRIERVVELDFICIDRPVNWKAGVYRWSFETGLAIVYLKKCSGRTGSGAGLVRRRRFLGNSTIWAGAQAFNR